MSMLNAVCKSVAVCQIMWWVLLVAVLLVLLVRRMRPRVHVNMGGSVAGVVVGMRSLQRRYWATPWLVGGNVQTMWGMRFRKRQLKYRREMMRFGDGGTCALDFYDPEGVENPPVLMIIHTLAGGTREPCSNNLAEVARRKGFRAFVYNNRGCSGVEFTSRRFYCALMYDDVQAVVAHVREKYRPPFLFLAGFSLGAYTAMIYDANDGSVDGVACVSHTYNGIVANEILSRGLLKRLYLPVMMEKVRHMFAKNKFVDYPKALEAKTLDEFDAEYTCKEYDIGTVAEYYQKCSIYDKIPRVNAPTLILGADNDPFTQEKLQPRKEVEASDKCVFVHVSQGGHVGFPIGWKADQSLIDVIVIDFFESIMREATQL